MRVASVILLAFLVLTVGVVGLSIAEWQGGSNTAMVSEHSTSSDFVDADLVDAEVSGDSVLFMDQEETASVNPPQYDSFGTYPDDYGGLVLNTREDIHQLDVDLRQLEAGSLDNVTLYEYNNGLGAQVASSSVSDLSASFSGLTLPAGNDYAVIVHCPSGDCEFYAGDNAEISDTEQFEVTSGYREQGGEVSEALLGIDAMTTYSKPETGQYTNTHAVTDATEATIDVSLTDSDATITVEANDGGSWVEVGSSSVQSGTQTIPLTAANADEYRVRVDTERTDFHGTATLNSESLSFDNTAPTVANLAPSDGTQTDEEITLSADISDPDFDTAQGDSVDVTFYDASDDSPIATKTITSNQTVTADWTSPDAGDNSWYITASDEYGGSTTTDTYTVTAPDTLYLYNVSSPQSIVDDTADVTVTFFGEDESVEKTTSDGTVDMSGVPADEWVIVDVEADGYHTRTAALPSIFEQQNVYLLPESADSVESTFILDDLTSQFSPDETVLTIERPIPDGEGGQTWKSVAGDRFGSVNEVSTILERDQRYRLHIENEDGAIRSIGDFTPTSPSSVPLQIGTIEWTAERDGFRWQTDYTENEEASDRIDFAFEDDTQSAENLQIRIYEQRNEDNELFSTTVPGPIDNYTTSVQVAGEDQNKTWVVEWSAERNGNDIGSSRVVGSAETVVEPPWGEGWMLTVVGIIIMFAAFMFGGIFAGIGSVIVSCIAGILWWMGWLNLPAGVILGAMLVGVLYMMGGENP